MLALNQKFCLILSRAGNVRGFQEIVPELFTNMSSTGPIFILTCFSSFAIICPLLIREKITRKCNSDHPKYDTNSLRNLQMFFTNLVNERHHFKLSKEKILLKKNLYTYVWGILFLKEKFDA